MTFKFSMLGKKKNTYEKVQILKDPYYEVTSEINSVLKMGNLKTGGNSIFLFFGLWYSEMNISIVGLCS